MTELRTSQYAMRDAAVQSLRADLVGPSDGPEEVLLDAPTTRYVAGVLYPVEEDTPATSTDDHDEPDEGEEGLAPDPGVARLAARRPSTCGLTFAVDTQVESVIRVSAEAARYIPVDEGGAPVIEPAQAGYELLAGRWRRAPADLRDVEVELTQTGDATTTLTEGLELFVRVRVGDKRGVVAVTAVLRNTASALGLRDLGAWLQVGLTVTGAGGAPCFVERRNLGGLVDDKELDSYDLLYRHARSYAVGHGCAVVWGEEDGDSVARLRTEFVPEAQLNLAESNGEIKSPALSMRFCAGAPSQELVSALRNLRADYDDWIARIEAAGSALPSRYREAVDRHLRECRRASERIGDGADLLEADFDSLRAFRLANEAMRLQRARTDWLRDGRPGEGPSSEVDGEWRPFQLAFILICLRGVAEPEHPDRGVVDLLWFPTGGGKTEAYLGLIAFTIFRRRLLSGSGGVTVLMRYTLRLLTLQQFSRAALLIACCERLRLDRGQLGDEKITLGLWVGRGATPNTRKEAETSLAQIKAGSVPADGDPRQLHACVWCGNDLRTDHYWSGDSPPRIAVSCRNSRCDFRNGLPVYLVDDDVYDYRPSLVIATADKFASIPWQPRIRALFGDGVQAPPELIVQDELHLISGPLGTLAGLYETAVDILCTSAAGDRPKVVASTATIRRATRQIQGLFDRESRQFPPPGIDARDSYFAVEAPPTAKANRSYVGVMAPATSQATAMVRTYARLLASAEEADVPAAVKDPYWTLLGYFSSLRVLGGARMQVQDDVVDRLKLLLGKASSRPLDLIEMTSRISSAEIPANLARMEVGLDTGGEVLDVVLATNMISVGVDIDRLGLMVVMGQPQATAEYIQATSRVGRRHPGLVAVVYNAARSRDRSHYESFQTYHGSLYRQVESTSVTPFSSRARDRGLHAVFIALCRLTIAGLAENKAAADIGSHLAAAERVKEAIVARAGRTEADDEAGVATAAATAEELDRVLEHWLARARQYPDLRYRDLHHPHRTLLVDAAGEGEFGALPTLYSLRDVDLESSLQLI